MSSHGVLDLATGGRLLLAPFPASPAALDAFVQAGAACLLTLTPAEEMAWLGLPAATLADRCRAAGLAWFHVPLADMSAGDGATLALWRATAPALHAVLDDGRAVALHCRMGLGRTGLAAALLLVERGIAPEDAIAAVRRARPGAVETRAQEALVHRWPGRHEGPSGA